MMKRRDTAEQSLIEGLSNIARRQYEMLSETDKKKLLRRADYIADKLEVKGYVRKEQISQTRRNSLAEKSMGDARAFNVRASAGGYGRGDDIKAGMSMSSNSVRRVGRTYILTVEYLLRSSPDPAGSERPDGDENEETYQNIAKIVHAGGDVASLRRHAGNGRDFKSEVKAFEGDISKKQKRNSFGRRQAGKKKSASRQRKNLLSKKLTKRRVKKKAAKDAGQATKRMSKAIQKVKKVLKKIMSKVVAMNPLAHLFALITLIIVIIAVMIGAVVAAFSGAGSNGSYLSYEAKVSERTESYRPLLEKYCEKYGIADYVELCLAMIEQESSGNPPDVMQTEQSYYNTHPPIDTPEESIDCGSHELADCLKKAGCTGPDDIENISLAIQGYNFGNGYIDWALKHYKGYSAENAKIFSVMMCQKLGYKRYGDVDYVPHVLRYYVPVEGVITNGDALKILTELKENNKGDVRAWKVIEKGATLIGKVKYSMDKRDDTGSDNPDYLDCSAFTAWAFHKGGFSGIPYTSTTATFRSSTKFVDISADKLQVGDIGLINSYAGTGGANHVGIYCGKLKDGRKVWLHCTSSSGTSLTGNSEGPMFGAYTGFGYFRHFKKFIG